LCHISYGCDTELLKIEAPGDYQKESWQMNEEEKLNAVSSLHAEGNSFFSHKDYKTAADKYAMAIGILEQLALV
jgi:AH receptor-interacting protein